MEMLIPRNANYVVRFQGKVDWGIKTPGYIPPLNFTGGELLSYHTPNVEWFGDWESCWHNPVLNMDRGVDILDWLMTEGFMVMKVWLKENNLLLPHGRAFLWPIKNQWLLLAQQASETKMLPAILFNELTGLNADLSTICYGWKQRGWDIFDAGYPCLFSPEMKASHIANVNLPALANPPAFHKQLQGVQHK